MCPQFVPGLELSRRFYHEAVEPLLRNHFGDLTHTAALIGGGSEVLGFDTDRSTDHDWGPRLQIFLGPADEQANAEKIVAMLADHLPKMFLGTPPTSASPTTTAPGGCSSPTGASSTESSLPPSMTG